MISFLIWCCFLWIGFSIHPALGIIVILALLGNIFD